MTRNRLIALVCAAALFAAAMGAQFRVDTARAEAGDGELLYLPNATLLQHFTAGMNSVVADLLWLRCVQYVATQAKGERSFKWLNKMLGTIVRLDPYFTDVYRYGGMFLAALKADSDAGIELLERGVVKRPRAWELPYEIGMVYLLNRGDQPGSRRLAAHYMGMAAAHQDAPPLIRELAAKLQGEYDLAAIERRMWMDLLESGDQLLRETAERKLKLLDLREAARILSERADVFKKKAGRAPESVAELARARLIRAVPEDPLGGRFFVGPRGRVYSSSVLDARKEDLLRPLREAIARYDEKEGRYPRTLDALYEEGYLTKRLENPYPGEGWEYDPETGEVR